jgi:predicted small lipoprotein YifL
MRGLFRWSAALFTLGLAMIGCGRSGSPDPAEDRPGPGPEDAPYQAAFRVPGMT